MRPGRSRESRAWPGLRRAAHGAFHMLHGMANLHRAGGCAAGWGGGSAALHVNVSCMERAGWSSGVFSAVKLNQSVSISGPWPHRNPWSRKCPDALQRERHRCKPPLHPALAGLAASHPASALSWACSSASANAWTTGRQCGFDRLLGQVDGSAGGTSSLRRTAEPSPS